MNIPHLTQTGRSVFYPQIRERLRQAIDVWPRHVRLNRTGGYSGNVTVTIRRINEAEFEANKELRDWTRFPARIRAAATALRDAGHRGRFNIVHQNGELSVNVNQD